MCTIIQWHPSYCLHVKRVKRLCYVHNIDAFNAMLKGSKEYVETRDIHIFAHNFLIIQPIFNLKKVLES